MRITETTKNWKLEQARKWCTKLTLAHFSVVLDTVTQKAVILWHDGRIWRDVPDSYQAGTVALLHSGESFTALLIPPRHEQSYLAQPSRQMPMRNRARTQRCQTLDAQAYRLLVS